MDERVDCLARPCVIDPLDASAYLIFGHYMFDWVGHRSICQPGQ